MDGLVEEGFIILDGPLDERDVLLVVQSETDASVRSRFAADPWIENGMLSITAVRPWTIFLEGRLYPADVGPPQPAAAVRHRKPPVAMASTFAIPPTSLVCGSMHLASECFVVRPVTESTTASATYVALRTMLPEVECGRRLQGIELAGATYFGRVEISTSVRGDGCWRQRPGFAIWRPNAIEHTSPEFRTGFEVHVRRVE
jgi:hypothetical protein